MSDVLDTTQQLDRARSEEEQYTFPYDDRSISSAMVIHMEAAGLDTSKVRTALKGKRGNALLQFVKHSTITLAQMSRQRNEFTSRYATRQHSEMLGAMFTIAEGDSHGMPIHEELLGDGNESPAQLPTSTEQDELPEGLASIAISSYVFRSAPEVLVYSKDRRVGHLVAVCEDNSRVAWFDGGATWEKTADVEWTWRNALMEPTTTTASQPLIDEVLEALGAGGLDDGGGPEDDTDPDGDDEMASKEADAGNNQSAMSEDGVHCPHCGVEIDDSVLRKSRNCPNCGGDMMAGLDEAPGWWLKEKNANAVDGMSLTAAQQDLMDSGVLGWLI